MVQQTASPALGSKAHNFALLDTVSDNLVSLQDVAAPKGTVIMFICNHCPYVKHVLPELVQLALHYKAQGIGFAAINANDAEQYPEDSPQKMKELGASLQLPFPYLYDQTQQVARSYGAECTPEFFVYDGNMRLYYHGQFDGSRPGGEPATGQHLRQALDGLLQQQAPPQPQQPSIGCGIKWRTY